jgi:hypothetical protein
MDSTSSARRISSKKASDATPTAAPAIRKRAYWRAASGIGGSGPARFSIRILSARGIVYYLVDRRRRYLFGDSAESTVSCALIPVGAYPCKGLFAMGSRELERFHPDLGTLFLDFLGAVIEQILQQYGH